MPIVSYDDARTLFSGSYVEHEGHVCAVVGIDRDSLLTLRNLESGEAFMAPADPLLVTAPITHQIGYCQLARGARYWKRKPIRTYKVGVSTGNTDGACPIEEIENSQSLRKLVSNMFQKKYPTLAQALASVTMNQERCKLVAFDRQWAVYSGGILMYAGEQIGVVVDENGNITQGRMSAYQLAQFEALKG